ncbi:glutathione peroxidase [Ningiella sp. W23]|uniref:glutathione peroxidase n=1 Tax=Ningiella sp. W23 TaxID=3023715 RepID=UPI0037580BDD
MKKLFAIASLLAITSTASANTCPDTLKHMKRKLNSQEVVNLCDEYAGKAVLFVNTASKCGFTPQFEGLEALYSNYKDDGLVVLGFPSNDFAQEYSDESKTAEVCELTYGVNFPMFEPISVRGENADPLYAKLAEETGKSPKWNFNKYLMDKNGKVVAHYGSRTKPDDEDFLSDVNAALSVEGSSD